MFQLDNEICHCPRNIQQLELRFQLESNRIESWDPESGVCGTRKFYLALCNSLFNNFHIFKLKEKKNWKSINSQLSGHETTIVID